ncbi:hypothetical protein BS47DRAFT_1397799 [Hydnum rufescens UP504]|uniref:Uncharacterized protein n=1 Tax=Hydnum rufescens UP504 TaxID=1448309 RepID=A0A9P6AMS2_9AGAM|nr:hypothetical protein BS47DRAFT_1397799 [Hydnum rufescens UP504]
MALYLPHTIFLILILSPVIPLILILVPIPIPIPILILILISVHMPIPVPVPVPILILAPMPVLPSQILVFPPIATILPVPILVPILDLAPLPITLIVPGFPTILLSSILPSMMLHVLLLLLQLQAYNLASQYQLVPGHFQTLQTLGLFHQLAQGTMAPITDQNLDPRTHELTRSLEHLVQGN